MQRVWDVNHAIWFTLMGLGGGVFLAGRILNLTEGLGALLGIPTVDVVSFVAIAVGGAILVADLGRPLQAWRAFVNVRTSWISWGAWSDSDLPGDGGAAGAARAEPRRLRAVRGTGLGSPRRRRWPASHWRSWPVAAALVVMTYAGVVLARPKAIPYWNSLAVPLQFLLSSAAMSVAVVMLIEVIAGETISGGQVVLLALLCAGLVLAVESHVSTRTEQPGKKESIELLRGRYRRTFRHVVLLGTCIVPALAFLVEVVSDDGLRAAFAVLSCVLLLVGGFLLRLITLRVGHLPAGSHPVGTRPGIRRPHRRLTAWR